MMNTKSTIHFLLFTLLLVCEVSPVHAQLHDNHWIFGYNWGSNSNPNGVLLHFEQGYPQFTIEDVKQDYGLYCIICSDSSGQLLFHSNGRRIRNRLHQIMEGGDTINPGPIWTDYPFSYPSITGGFAIPDPRNDNQYYIIHTSASYSIYPFPILYYTWIDMNENGGLGKVLSKNNIMAEGDIPSPVAIKHGNGRDWWVIAGDQLTQSYYIFLIDQKGLKLTQQQFIAPASLTNYGYAKASPNGEIFVMNDDSTGLWFFDFDRCNGTLSNPRVLPYAPPVFWTATNAFSENGRFFYAGTYQVIYQLDMQTIDSAWVAFDTIARYDYGAVLNPTTNTYFSLPELVGNGKIYSLTLNGSTAFHVTNQPDFPLQASDMEQRGLLLPRRNDKTRCYFPNYRLGKLEGSACDTLAGFKPVMPQHHERNDAIRILKLPPGFHLPAGAEKPLGQEPYNPLNQSYILQQRLRQTPLGSLKDK